MSDTPIEFYFDFNSPYGYIAAHLLDDLAAKHGRTVDWKPILLGAIFKVTGGKPLPEQPMKGEYHERDFVRSATLHGVEFNFPSSFPFSPVAASRAVYWAKDQAPQNGRKLGLALYQAALRDDRDISSPEVVASVASEAGLDKEAVLAALQDGEVKARLMREVEEAIGKGVFGSPYVIVDGEPFWGVDRLDQVDRWLATGGW